jgi:predicted MFS family arabinose efflux permease
MPPHPDVPSGRAAVVAPAVPAPITVRGGLGRFIPAVAVAPGVALALANVGYGTMAGFVVLLLEDRGIGSGASVFTAFAGTVVASRLLFAKLPDQIGPRLSAFGAGIAQACGCALVGAAHSLPMALVGAVVMGTGMSLLFPSLALLVTRRVEEARRGAALGSFTAFFDVGVGLGAPFAGVIASLGAGENYAAAFYAAALCCLAGALIGYISSRRVPEAMA